MALSPDNQLVVACNGADANVFDIKTKGRFPFKANKDDYSGNRIKLKKFY